MAQASVYPWAGFLVYDCVSLSRAAGLTVRENGRVVWAPTAAGITFADMPAAPRPAASVTVRLSQMKALADQFKVTMTGLKADLSDREQMRMLPKPIYRYELAEGQREHPDLIDGAVFSFVQGTDPEALLLIEAIQRTGKPAWQYAFARATASGLEARLGSSIVWTAPRAYGSNDPSRPTIVLGRPLVR